MISRRTFLKRLGLATVIAMADPLMLYQSVQSNAPVEDVLGPILETIKLNEWVYPGKKVLYLAANEYDKLEAQIPPEARFTFMGLVHQGFDNLLIKGIPIVRKP